jgi:hypothetical protein
VLCDALEIAFVLGGVAWHYAWLAAVNSLIVKLWQVNNAAELAKFPDL